MIKYKVPTRWIHYDFRSIANELVNAKASVMALQSTPYQRIWVDALYQIQLKREVAGTSRIEGAEFTDKELDVALKESPEQLITRSQRQAHAAVKTYRWLPSIPDDRPVDVPLILDIHRRLVTGADDDHCPPGQLRKHDQNVTFGSPRHRGAEGGKECEDALAMLAQEGTREYKEHDLLIQALAFHYHFAAMHPFLDGNGRTARAVEALLLQRAGLRDVFFIAMSNYYYDEKNDYLASLSKVRANDHDLTAFLIFGLRGISVQCKRLLEEIKTKVSKALFRNMMYDLFLRIRNKRTRVIARRQLSILKRLLEVDSIDFDKLFDQMSVKYKPLRNSQKAFVRDLNNLIRLKAITCEKLSKDRYIFMVRLEWPTEITETAFFEQLKDLPKAKTHSFLQ
jgi:Fic family protein